MNLGTIDVPNLITRLQASADELASPAPAEREEIVLAEAAHNCRIAADLLSDAQVSAAIDGALEYRRKIARLEAAEEAQSATMPIGDMF